MQRATSHPASPRRVTVLAPMRSELQPLRSPLALARSREQESEFLWGWALLALADPDGTPNLAEVARFVLKQPHRIPQLLRLARGANAATRAAADAAALALEGL